MADIAMSSLDAQTTVNGAERMLILDGSTSKTLSTDKMAAYAVAQLTGATAISPASGDILFGDRSDTAYTFTIDTVSTYAVGYVWGAASEADPTASGDMLLVDRSGTKYTMDVDTLKTYVNTGQQATILDISGLSSATLDSTDYFLVGEGSNARNATLAALETKLWTDLDARTAALTTVSSVNATDDIYTLQSGVAKSVTPADLADYVVSYIVANNSLDSDYMSVLNAYVTGLDAVTSPVSTDVFYCSQSSTDKYVTLEKISDYVVEQAKTLPWTLVSDSKYTATPASTSTITMSDTSDMAVGLPVKYAYGGTTYYGIITAVTTNTSIAIAGATLNVGVDLTSLYVGTQCNVVQMDLFLSGDYDGGVQDLLANINSQYVRWRHGNAYLVQFSAVHGTADTGASQGKLNCKVGGSVVSTDDSNNGIQLSTAGTWVNNSAIGIHTTNYAVAALDAIEVNMTASGTNGNATDLSVSLVFVLE